MNSFAPYRVIDDVKIISNLRTALPDICGLENRAGQQKWAAGEGFGTQASAGGFSRNRKSFC